jgi:hypothetical protein
LEKTGDGGGSEVASMACGGGVWNSESALSDRESKERAEFSNIIDGGIEEGR